MKYRLIHWLDKLGLLNELDYTPPESESERPHAYEAKQTFRPARDNERKNDIPVGECCSRCSGGKRHKVHRPPFQLDHTRGTSMGYEGGPHAFVRREDGYCQECGAGKFYGLHLRVPAAAPDALDYDFWQRMQQAQRGEFPDPIYAEPPSRALGDH